MKKIRNAHPGLASARVLDEDKGLHVAKRGQQFGDLLVAEVRWDMSDADLVARVPHRAGQDPLLVIRVIRDGGRDVVLWPAYRQSRASGIRGSVGLHCIGVFHRNAVHGERHCRILGCLELEKRKVAFFGDLG